jgi:NADPH:quinone reductase-like Zn-dependent oxidoreductase
MKAVQFDRYGGIDVLDVREVPTPSPGEGELLVRVRATGINPGEGKIRQGELHDRWPATFPSGEGSDLAGVVEALGDGVSGFAAGDEVIGFVHDRSSHAEHAVVPAEWATPKPEAVPWEVAGGLYVAGATAWAAVRSVSLGADDAVVVSAAAGGVGSLVVQLAARSGARVIGLASDANHEWLRAHGVIPVAYGDGLAARIRDAARGGAPDAFIDCYGAPYVELAIELGVAVERIDTIADFEGAAKHGVKTEGSMEGSTAAVLAELGGLIAAGELEMPVAATFPLSEVRAAFTELEQGHTRGKIVLVP